MSAALSPILVDGEAVVPERACLPITDLAFQRGYGCFETMRAYRGRIFRRDAHLERLSASAARLRIPLPPRDLLRSWVDRVAAPDRDASVRVVVTGGTDPARPGRDSRTVVYAEVADPPPEALSLGVRLAPWHADGVASELTGAKVLSYAFNLAATLSSREDGFDDALLVGRSGRVLEGPTFSVAWVVGGQLRTPSLDLGILASITRGAVLEVASAAGVPVLEGRLPLDDLLGCDEVMAMSTTKEVVPVVRVGDRSFSPGPVTRLLSAGFRDLVEVEVG